MNSIVQVAYRLANESEDANLLVMDLMEVARTVCDAERASIFLPDFHADGTLRELVAYSQTGAEVRVPPGQGIVGLVATTREKVVVQNAYECSTFYRAVDNVTGFATQSVLCAPVQYDGALVAVAELINKRAAGKVVGETPMDLTPEASGGFTKEDEEHFQNLCTLIGLCLCHSERNKQLMREKEKMDTLFRSITVIAEADMTDTAAIQRAVVRGAKALAPHSGDISLISYEKEHRRLRLDVINDTVLSEEEAITVDEEADSVVAACFRRREIVCWLPPAARGFGESQCAMSRDPNMDAPGVPLCCIASIVAVPIMFKDVTMGVLQIVSKTKDDSMMPLPSEPSVIAPIKTESMMIAIARHKERFDNATNPSPQYLSLLKGFAVFAGVWIRNSDFIDFTVKASKAATKLTTGFRMRRTEGGNTPADKAGLSLLRRTKLPGDIRETMQTPQFDLWKVRDISTTAPQLIASRVIFELIMSTGLPQQFNCKEEVLAGFIVACRSKYRSVPYHSFFHAVDVTQTIYHFLYTGDAASCLRPLDQFVLFAVGLTHDLDHMGLNNSYYLKTDSPLGILSAVGGNQSVLEVHHCNLAIDILANTDLNIFGGLEKEEESKAYRLLVECILGTDMAKHADAVTQLKAWDSSSFDIEKQDHRRFAATILTKAADISNVTKPFEISRRWGEAVVEEFSQQGDREKKHGITNVPAMFDREQNADLAKGQIGFIEFVAQPFFELVVEKLFPKMRYTVDQIYENKEMWKTVAPKPR